MIYGPFNMASIKIEDVQRGLLIKLNFKTLINKFLKIILTYSFISHACKINQKNLFIIIIVLQTEIITVIYNLNNLNLNYKNV
jgi:hypothetical protein